MMRAYAFCNTLGSIPGRRAMTSDNVEATLRTDAVGAPFPVAPIDCDIHPAVPGIGALLPYFGELWRDMIVLRGIDKLALSLTSYPANAPAADGAANQATEQKAQ